MKEAWDGGRLYVTLTQDYLSSELCCPSAMTRLMRYDGQQLSRPEDGVYGTGPHTDWGVLTLLAVVGGVAGRSTRRLVWGTFLRSKDAVL